MTEQDLSDIRDLFKSEMRESVAPLFEELKWGLHTLNHKVDNLKIELKDEIGGIRHDLRAMEARLEIKIGTNTLAIAELSKDLKLVLKNKVYRDIHNPKDKPF